MRSEGWTPKEIQAAAMSALLTRVAPPIFKEHFTPRCCINATRVGMDALRRFRVESFPLPVQVTGYSPTAAEKVLVGKKPEQGVGGDWMTSIGFGKNEPNEEGFDGHLVLIVARRFMVDLSIGQMARPEHKLETAPFWMDVGRDFNRQGAVRTFRSTQGTMLRYQVVPERSAWKETSGWMPKRNEPVMLKVVDALTTAIEERNKET